MTNQRHTRRPPTPTTTSTSTPTDNTSTDTTTETHTWPALTPDQTAYLKAVGPQARTHTVTNADDGT